MRLTILQLSPVGWGIAASHEAADPKQTRFKARIEVFNFIRHLDHFQAPVIAKRQIHNMPRSAAGRKLRFSIFEVARQAVRVLLFNFCRNCIFNPCRGQTLCKLMEA